MRALILAVIVVATGCSSQTQDRQALLAEAFVNAAYEAVRVPAPAPPQKCCGKCSNGKVRSGDGIAWVECPCEKSCPCKGARR